MQFSLVELSFVSVNYDFQKITCNTNHHHPHYLSPWDLFFNCFHYSFILTNPLCLSAAKFSRFSSIKKVHFLYQNKIVYIRLIYVKILILWVDQMKKMEWKILLPFLLASCLFLLVLLNGATYWLVANAYKSMYTYLCFHTSEPSLSFCSIPFMSLFLGATLQSFLFCYFLAFTVSFYLWLSGNLRMNSNHSTI